MVGAKISVAIPSCVLHLLNSRMKSVLIFITVVIFVVAFIAVAVLVIVVAFPLSRSW